MYLKCTVADGSGTASETVSAISGKVTIPQLAGAAQIVGDYVYEGGTLSAVVNGTQDSATLSFSWYAGNEQGSMQELVGTGLTYTLKAQDVGKFITCVVRDTSGAFEGEVVAEGSLVTAVLSLAVPDRLQGTLSALGEITWQDFGMARSEGSCAARIASARSSVPGQEAAICSLKGAVLQPGTNTLISWTGLGSADPAVYAQAALAAGSFVHVGALTYVFEPA